MTTRRITTSAVGLLLLGVLAACQSGDGEGVAEGDYPSLYAVPDRPRPNLTVDERRQIVRGLIDERDQNRVETAVVRGRSGLETNTPDDAAAGKTDAAEVVPETPDGEGEAFRLKARSKVPADSVYRGDAQFEDGSLDDFIRQLKRDTRPTAPAPEGQPAAEPLATDEATSFLDPAADLALVVAGQRGLHLIPAFAPAVHRRQPGDDDLLILLAASGEEPGTLCRYFGWAVAWSTMCLSDTETASPDEEREPVGADLEQELRNAGEAETSGRETEPSSSGDQPGRETVGRRLSEEDAAEAIEDVGRSVLAPVTSSIDRLRDYLEERQQAREAAPSASSPDRDTPSARPATPSARAAAPDPPPIPEGRPERREDIVLVDKGERFEFIRTPRPAFKPSPDLPVIMPPASEPSAAVRHERRMDPPPAPAARPSDLLTGRDAGRPVAAVSEPSDETGRDANDGAVALALATDLGTDAAAGPPPGDPVETGGDRSEPAIPKTTVTPKTTIPKVTIIDLEPDRQGVPEGANAELMALLVDAKARGQKIHIIGEASSNHVARRRATDVGAVLVQLGATVEILEYDHQVITNAERVRLVLMPDPSLSQARSPNPPPVDN